MTRTIGRSCLLVLLLAIPFVACITRSSQRVSGQEESRPLSRNLGFAVVELFTSQGCSSCPSADQNLERITAEAERKKLAVFTLSFHVDYWNSLGWEDPFSSAQATQRQRQYAVSFGSRRVYTPQMIVNGQVEFVGSNRQKANDAINNVLHRTPNTMLAAAARHSDDNVTVTWDVTGSRDDDVLHAALVQNRAQRNVTAGENTGRELQHVNVVRGYQSVEAPAATRSLKLAVPEDFSADAYHVVAYVQSKSDATIHAATRITIDPRDER